MSAIRNHASGQRFGHVSRTSLGRLTLAAAAAALLSVAAAGHAGAEGGPKALVDALREAARKVNGFTAEVSVKAGAASQSGTLLYLAPDRVHMEMKVAGLGEQKVLSDGRTL